MYKVGWFTLGLLPFAITATPFLDVSVVSWSTWPGHTKGLEISALDLLVVALLLGRKQAARALPAYVTWAFILYVLSIVVSILNAYNPAAGAFYLWQTCRVALLFYLVATTDGGYHQKKALLSGLACGLILEFVLAVWQRFVLGDLNATGTIGHQNGFGMVCNLVAIPLFSMVLANSGRNQYLLTIGGIAGLLCSALTVSRAATGLAALGVILLVVVSTFSSPTSKKYGVLVLLMLSVVAVSPLVATSFNKRFDQSSGGGDYNEREAFETAARLMAKDHIFGVGANNYVVVANAQGYSEQAGVHPREQSRGALVHNVYLLAAAESGYFGMLALAGLLLTPLCYSVMMYRTAGRNADFQLGLLVSVAVIYIHSFFEFGLIMVKVQYFYAIILGLLVQSTEQVRSEQSTRSLRFVRSNRQHLPLQRSGLV